MANVPASNPSNDTDSIEVNSLKLGDPVWKMALMFPRQGGWTEADYLSLDAGQLVEFDNGFVEVLEMPTWEHQRIVRFLAFLMQSFVEERKLGEVLFAPLPVKLWEAKFREPDILFLKAERVSAQKYPEGADLVVEVVSDDAKSRKRDLITKLSEYATAGIEEYWIVDATQEVIFLNCLVEGTYQSTPIHRGDMVHSFLLNGFSVPAADVFDAAKQPR